VKRAYLLLVNAAFLVVEELFNCSLVVHVSNCIVRPCKRRRVYASVLLVTRPDHLPLWAAIFIVPAWPRPPISTLLNTFVHLRPHV